VSLRIFSTDLFYYNTAHGKCSRKHGKAGSVFAPGLIVLDFARTRGAVLAKLTAYGAVTRGFGKHIKRTH
jgi:hypothetical protein